MDNRNRPLRSERHRMSKPQIFVHLEFGVSWSQQHTPRTHAVTYTSRNLKNARDRGNFPRKLPPVNANFLAAPETHQHQQQQQHRPRENTTVAATTTTIAPNRHHQSHQHRGQGRPGDNGQARAEQTRDYEESRRESRSSRGTSHERGSSAPPPFSDSPWDNQGSAAGPSATLFPTSSQQQQQPREQPHVWKPLPEAPGRYRLGEDGLPWSAWAWPVDPYAPSTNPDEADEEQIYANQPTTDPMSPERYHSDDGDESERARELESLSAAMMTVDNGFENQWWYQGTREPMHWFARDQEEPSRLSMADAALLSAAEPMSSEPPEGWYAPSYETAPSFDGIVSPLSGISSPQHSYRPLQRSLTTRSEELFLGNI